MKNTRSRKNEKKRNKRKIIRLQRLENNRLKEVERINSIIPDTVEGQSTLNIIMLQPWVEIPEDNNKNIPVDSKPKSYFSYKFSSRGVVSTKITCQVFL